MPVTVKRGDTPTLRWVCKADGQPADITGWEARLLVRLRRGGEPVIDAVLSGGDPENGVVEYTLGSDELAVGFYQVEIQTSSGGTILTYPQDDYESISVINDLGP